MMSGRLPLARSWNVGGKSDTCWNQIVPGDVVVMVKMLSLDAFPFLAVKVTSYFFQPLVSPATSTLARSAVSLVLAMASLSGPWKPSAALA